MSPHSAGNASIMRLAPVPMFYYPDLAAAVHYSAESSRTTHGAAECLDACCTGRDNLPRALRRVERGDSLWRSELLPRRTEDRNDRAG